MARALLVCLMLLGACVGSDYDASPGDPYPSCTNSAFAIDVPTKQETWMTRDATLAFSGQGGREPMRWRNALTGATGAGHVVENLQYDPLFCPMGCPVRRFGGSVPLAEGVNPVDVSDADTCTDSITVTYVPYPTDCAAQPTLTITKPSSAASVTVVAGEMVEVAGTSTGEIESMSWYAGGFDSGSGAFAGGPWSIVLPGLYVTRTFSMTVVDRCGHAAHAMIDLVVP
jgi:hypothetical protein